MSLNSELALAARSIRALADRIPEANRPDVAALWTDLMEAVEDSRSEGGALLALIEHRQRIEALLSA